MKEAYDFQCSASHLYLGREYKGEAVNRLKRLVFRFGPAAFILDTDEGSYPVILMAASGIADLDIIMPRVVLIAVIATKPKITLFLEERPVEAGYIKDCAPGKADVWCEQVADLLDMFVA